MSDLRTLVDGGSFFEGPRWHDGRWWVSDFYRRAVLAIDEGGATETVLEVANQPSGLGWAPDGSLLVVSMLDHSLLRRSPSGDVEVVASFAELCGGFANDMVVDASGRAYVGNAGFDVMSRDAAPRNATLVRVDPDGTASVAADDLAFPNGTVITPDGSTMIVGETMGQRYTAFTVDADGSLTDRRVWAEVAPVAPDGCALDAEGRIWAADAFGSRCVLVEEGGRIAAEVVAPDGLGVYACMLGGADGDTLLLCCAPDFYASRRREAREAVLLTTTVDVPHAGLP